MSKRVFARMPILPIKAFTLVELIVVITILAILATIGFLALSGYSQDAKDSAIKANVRSVLTAIVSESSISGNSPRYYVVHDTGAALSGAVIMIDWTPTVLTWGDWNQSWTNYSAGNPDWTKLKMNPEKFRISSFRKVLPRASASWDRSSVSVWSVSVPIVNVGKTRSVSYVQTVGISPTTKVVSVAGNFPTTLSGSVSWLVRNPASASSTGAFVDGEVTTLSKSNDVANCASIKSAQPSSASGTYSIDPDGEGGAAPLSAYCDMSTDGGGWTKIVANAPLAMQASSTFTRLNSVSWTETMIRYVSGSATYGATSWDWDWVFVQRMCLRTSTPSALKYFSTNGRTITNGCENGSASWGYYGCGLNTAGQFVATVRMGPPTGRACNGGGAPVWAWCYEYAIAPAMLPSDATAFDDCEKYMVGSGHADNSGTIYYDIYVR